MGMHTFGIKQGNLHTVLLDRKSYLLNVKQQIQQLPKLNPFIRFDHQWMVGIQKPPRAHKTWDRIGLGRLPIDSSQHKLYSWDTGKQEATSECRRM